MNPKTIGLGVIIISLISVYALSIKYSIEIIRGVKTGATAECESKIMTENEITVSAEMEKIIKEQEEIIKTIRDENERAADLNRSQNQRINKLNKKLSDIKTHEKDCDGINDDTLRMLNESANEYNKCSANKCGS